MHVADNLELWGGIECTINRVGDQYFDQLHYAGHYERADDIQQIAALGIKKIRYPVLWEQHQFSKQHKINWRRSAERLDQIRQQGMTPIVGLLHHGSGPAFTNLLDPDFATGLAGYGAKVARRFPWVEYYTPVNEPLTTARFSGLYGIWYPHHRNDISFARMLLNQLKATVLTMKAIRKINPGARLVQTEDLAKTYSTPYLSFQAGFENERRWLTYDLLCGKLKKGDLMWEYFIRLGIPETDLLFFQNNPCPPDIIGFNYYITSERYLDEALSKYPVHTHGGNELQEYADVEAVRVPHNQPWGLKTLLMEAWNRFQLPMAVTECHLNCTREEQLRWLKETWDTVLDLRKEQVDVRAVTAWSLLGSFGWDQLLTHPEMRYEPGVFDVRSGSLRKTALAGLITALNNGLETHSMCDQPGWWRRSHHQLADAGDQAPVLILGSTGTLGNAFARVCKMRGLSYRLLGRSEVDITDRAQVENVIGQFNPWAIINATGYVRVDDAEEDEESCYASNTAGPVLLATAAADHAIPLVCFSSDLVFDGAKEGPYLEEDEVNPLNIYGKTKALAEQQVITMYPRALVIRTSAFFGPWDKHNFPAAVIHQLRRGLPFEAAADVYVSPTYVPDLVHHTLDLLIDGETGIRHLANRGRLSWAEFAVGIARRYGLDESLILKVSGDDMNWKAVRPKSSALDSSREHLMSTITNAMDRYALETEPHLSFHPDHLEGEIQPLKI